jgi:transcriptional antiterminator RfaH
LFIAKLLLAGPSGPDSLPGVCFISPVQICGATSIRLGTGLESQSWSPIRSTVGVSRLVTFGQTPAKIDDALVSELRTKSESTEVQLRHFEPGEQVVVTDGPFVGVEAFYQMADGEGRVMVLLNILSKTVKMAVSPASIRKVR